MPPPFHLSFRAWKFESIVPRSTKGRWEDACGTSPPRIRNDFFLRSSFVRRKIVNGGGGRTFVRRSLATTSLARPHCSRERHDWNPHTGLLSQNSGRVWPDRFSTSSSISRNWSNRSPDGEYHPDQPIHRFLSFLDGIQEISKHVLFSTIFAFPILPLYSLSGSNKRSYETIKLVPSVT